MTCIYCKTTVNILSKVIKITSHSTSYQVNLGK